MTNFSVVENKISAVRKYLLLLERYKKCSQKEIEGDVDIRGALERYLYLVAQSAIDLAEAFISFKNFRKPATLSESFYILNENNVIDTNLTEKMVKMSGFRNVISHDYGDLGYGIVYDVLQNKLADLEEFLEVIEGQ